MNDGLELSTLLSNYEMVQLETNQESLIGVNARVCITDKHIVGINPDKILIFDRNGTFINLFFILLFLLSGCNGRDVQAVLIEYEKLQSGEFFDQSNFSKATSVTLDSKTGILGENLFLKFDSDNTYLLDRQQSKILVYNSSNGSLLSSICNEGRGPGEYLYIKDFYIDPNKEILLLCDAKPKVLKYTQAGQFISESFLSFNALSFSKQKDKYWFFKERISHPIFYNNTIVKTDTLLKPVGSYLGMQESMVAAFAEMNFSTSQNGEILFKHVFDNTIYKIVRGIDSLLPAYVIDWGSYEYPDSFIKAKSFSDAFTILNSTTTASVVSAFENSDFLLLYIAEEGVKNNFGYFLYNRSTEEILFQKFEADDLIIRKLGAPKALTDDNAIVFIVNGQMVKELESSIPILAQMDLNQLDNNADNYVLLKLYIN
ncbi:hypothetical protein SDC9_43234 [bioreactor metagenome]|uniref:6-bladed beta-propeller n=1 Tax=bioreactor metagenome TaxID=1076179 RepID=A0A644W0M0_9ZZZZ|nr:6-bladed beta-propeller [Rikenellaceae bacterium]